MSAATTQPITLEEFLKLLETTPASEYINDEIIQKPMLKGRHSRLQGKLCAAINQVTEEPRIAYAFSELRCSFGNRSIILDVAIFLGQPMPFIVDSTLGEIQAEDGSGTIDTVRRLRMDPACFCPAHSELTYEINPLFSSHFGRR